MEALCSCSLLTVPDPSLGDAFVSEAAFTLETEGAVQLLLQHNISYCAGVLFSFAQSQMRGNLSTLWTQVKLSLLSVSETL